MPSVDELSGGQSSIAGTLRSGVDVLRDGATVTFTRYIRLVLPLDGYVFWVRADIVSKSAAFNVAAFGTVAPNQTEHVTQSAATLTAPGSIHYSSHITQDEDESYTPFQVVFTSEVKVTDFQTTSPSEMWIGQSDGVRFAFSDLRFYLPTGLWHYIGASIPPVLESQIVDTAADLNARDLIASNSLPIWLGMSLQPSPLPFPTPMAIQLFPSFLVPDNMPPPYGVVHIPPDSLQALQATPSLGPTYSHSQLVRERVRITLYGARNFNAMDFVDYVNNYSLYFEQFGLANMPVVRDEKRTYPALGVLASKKTIDYEINYYQTQARNLARQLILHCIPTFSFS